MARVNVGVDPRYLSDQHLIAESVEITMITGSLRTNDYRIKGAIPPAFVMGKGHINFFKDKLLYLTFRLHEVNCEITRRGYKPGTSIDLHDFPSHLQNQWSPGQQDSDLVRARIVDRLLNPKSGRNGGDLHRYKGKQLGSKISDFGDAMLRSELFFV